MICASDGKDDASTAVHELRLKITDEGGGETTGYMKLLQCDDVLGSEVVGGRDNGRLAAVATAQEKDEEWAKLIAAEHTTPPRKTRWGSLWKWVKLGILLAFLGVLTGVFLKWISPFLMNKELLPMLNWERTTFSTPLLALIVFVSVAVFPILLLPSTPSMWVAGMTFGYGYGFLLIMPAVAIGVSVPFFIGSLFNNRIQSWLKRYPKKASVIRLAGEGDWMTQFKAVFLIRISPFPYILYNYCAVATDVNFGPYFWASLGGMVPDVLIAIYTGILIRTLAKASHGDEPLSAKEITVNILGFCTTLTTTVICTVYAKRRLKKIETEEETVPLQG